MRNRFTLAATLAVVLVIPEPTTLLIWVAVLLQLVGRGYRRGVSLLGQVR